MAWRMIRQPNGRIARFSEVVDHFTDYDMDEREAFDLCFELMGREEARAKVARCDEPGRYEEALETIRVIHGEDEAEKTDQLLRGASDESSHNETQDQQT